MKNGRKPVSNSFNFLELKNNAKDINIPFLGNFGGVTAM
jgi:hypothetical protein